MLISGKGKYFHVFGCISKNFLEKIFWCLEKKKENTNLEKHKPQPRKNSNTVQILPLGSLAGAISLRRDRDQRRDLTIARSRSTARSHEGEIAIDESSSRISRSSSMDLPLGSLAGAISRRRDRDRRIFLSDLVIFLDGSSSRISRRRRRDLARREIVLLLSRARALSLSLSHFPEML